MEERRVALDRSGGRTTRRAGGWEELPPNQLSLHARSRRDNDIRNSLQSLRLFRSCDRSPFVFHGSVVPFGIAATEWKSIHLIRCPQESPVSLDEIRGRAKLD